MTIRARSCFLALLGSAILAFGLCHVHAYSGVTEGGILGLTLLLRHWFDISPAVSGFVMNAACYLLGWRTLGTSFVVYSLIAGGGFSVFYALFERMQPVFPMLADHPLLAALVGALFVGIGIGISVRAGGAPGGDDALAMSLSSLLHQPIERIYLVSDLIVLALSATYIPPVPLLCSLLTVVLSGQIIGFVQNMHLPSTKAQKQA